MSVLMVNLNNIMKFDDFVKEENEKVGKEPVKSVKEYNDAIKFHIASSRGNASQISSFIF